MSSIPAFGRSLQNSNLSFLLQDQLNGMGDYLTKEVGSIAWLESLCYARAMDTAGHYLQLLANQLNPIESSILLNMWQQVFNATGLTNEQQILSFIGQKQSQFGTFPNNVNIKQYLQNILGVCFINIQWIPELQFLATNDPVKILDGYTYQSPLSTTLVYIWQPRDNQDNLLMDNATFNLISNSYLPIVDQWSPAYTTFLTLNLTNRGNQDGYGNGYNGFNYNNYLDGYNVINGIAGTTTITGINTVFLLYPNGQPGDFAFGVSEGFYPPIQIVDDAGKLQTYFVSKVHSNNSLTITLPLINNITNRTYRCLGIICDTNQMLDAASLFNE